MLYQFVITPEVFHPDIISEFPALESAIGFILESLSKNGMIANLHQGEWHKLVVGRLLPALGRTMPELQGDIRKFLEFLDRHERLILHPRYDKTEPLKMNDWLDAAEDRRYTTPLTGIIVSPKLYSRSSTISPLINASKAYKSPLKQNCPTSIDVKTERLEYRECLAPILRYARVLHLIDPYMNCDYDYRQLLELCCQLLGEGIGIERRRYINIHIGESSQTEPDTNRISAIWKQTLDNLVKNYAPRKYEFTVSLWRDFRYEDKNRFHDRYILTNQCGIAVQYGLRMTKGNRTTWTLLEDTIRQARLDDHIDSGKYRLLDRLIVPERTD